MPKACKKVSIQRLKIPHRHRIKKLEIPQDRKIIITYAIVKGIISLVHK